MSHDPDGRNEIITESEPKKRKHEDGSSSQQPQKSSRKQMSQRFRFGNYDRYYQYRNTGHKPDVRLSVLSPDWFTGKEVLDIGCNAGRMTIAIAKSFRPKLVMGIDVDEKLIQQAAINVSKTAIHNNSNRRPCLKLDSPVTKSDHVTLSFPDNICFAIANYVLPDDESLTAVTEEYDTIVCLSVTKWIHLNWGDEGIRRAFKRMYRQLRKSGVLILEPQPWSSYVKKHNMCDETIAHFRAIKFMPDQFKDYLMSDEIGYSHCDLLPVPQNESKGFCRPIYCFTK